MTDDRDRLREALSPTSECPSIEQLARYVDAVLDGAERSALEPHIRQCSHCQSELALLQQFAKASVRPEEASSVAWIEKKLQSCAPDIGAASRPKYALPVPWWKTLFATPALGRAAMVLGCLLVVFGASLYVRRGFAPALNPALDSGSDVTRSNLVPLISPKGDLNAKPDSLEWQAVPGAVRYRVSMMEVDRTEFWQAETTAASIALPPAAKARIQAAKSLLWRVIALDAAGGQVGSSDLGQFRLVPDVPRKTP